MSEHKHAESCSHDHGNEKLAQGLYILGLSIFLLSFLIKNNVLLKNALLVFSMLSAGYHIIVSGVKDTFIKTRVLGKLTPNVHILMTLAAFGAMLIGDFGEGALLIIIFAGAHFLEDYAEGKSRKEIINLLDMNPSTARLIQSDGSYESVDVSVLEIGDRLQVLNGDQIASDGIIVSGSAVIDESSITGESIAKEKTIGDLVYGATLNGNSSFVMEVTKRSDETVFAKVITLVNQSQSNMSETATTLKRLEPKYVNLVLIAVPIFILMGPFIFSWTWMESFYKGMVFLTVASPCALAASAVPASLSAISNLAKKGVLFKGGSYLSNLAQIKAVAFDKTGTLTMGKPTVSDVEIFGQDDALIDVVVSMEKKANHPLADAILNHFTALNDLDLSVENKIGVGLRAEYQSHSYRIGKPESFDVVDELILDKIAQFSKEGKTVVLVSKDDRVLMIIAMMDLPNEHAIHLVSYLKSQNIHTSMITGDAEITGKAIAKQIGMDSVMGNVLPEDKVNVVSALQIEHGMVLMLGDGVNDAPALVRADIGIAMGDGSDIAIDVSDAILMQNDLRQLEYAHRVSKKLDRVVWQNIFFSMSVVLILLILNILGKMNLPLGIIVHEGSTLVVIFNGLRLLKDIKKDA